jgi:hypothetical protein
MTTPINSHKDWTNKGGHVSGKVINVEPTKRRHHVRGIGAQHIRWGLRMD